MKKLSYKKMANTIIAKRKELKITQAQLSEMTGIHRGMISRIESLDYTPSIDQLQSIAEALQFEVVDLFEDEVSASHKPVFDRTYNIAVAGTGYVGLSIATLLAQHHQSCAGSPGGQNWCRSNHHQCRYHRQISGAAEQTR